MIYVGRTIDIDRRWEIHKKSVVEGTWGLYKHMRKIGVHFFYFQIICEVDYICDGDLHKVEMMELYKIHRLIKLNKGNGDKYTEYRYEVKLKYFDKY